MLTQFLNGLLDRNGMWEVLRQQQRYRQPRSDPGFGGLGGDVWGGGDRHGIGRGGFGGFGGGGGGGFGGGGGGAASRLAAGSDRRWGSALPGQGRRGRPPRRFQGGP